MHLPRSYVEVAAIALFVVTQAGLEAQDEVDSPQYDSGTLLGHLENDKVSESSGLAVSNRHPGVFWTHNDSGDKARLFAFDSQGKHRGTSHVHRVDADDWEDMGSFVLGGRCYLYVADVGDNGRDREDYSIHIFREPDSPKRDVRVAETIVFTYADKQGHNCEAVGLDVSSREFLLFEKQPLGFLNRTQGSVSPVWRLKWKPGKPTHRLVAERIGQINVPPIRLPLTQDNFPIRLKNAVTGLDVSADGRRLVLSSYGDCILFERAARQTWEEVLRSDGRTVPAPARLQGESVCFGTDGETLYLTSEKKPCPFLVIPTKKAP